MMLYKIQLPGVTPLTGLPYTNNQTESIIKIDKNNMLSNDIFGTYVAPIEEAESFDIEPLPEVPQEISITTPAEEPARFIEPLALSLTGIMHFDDARIDRAIILDNNSKQEITYKIGDSVQDAVVAAIHPQRILLIRSNGQQEYLYLAQDEVQKTKNRLDGASWNNMLNQEKNALLIDKQEFIKEVVNLSRFIDIFDLSTAFKDGISLGSKIGSIKEKTLPYALGFRSNDIILSIDTMPVRTTTERLDLFDHIKNLPNNSYIKIQLVRNGKPFALTYKLGEIERIAPEINAFVSDENKLTDVKSDEDKRQYNEVSEEEKQRILKEKYKFAATVKDLENLERKHIASMKQS
jgi:type II secretion system protein C